MKREANRTPLQNVIPLDTPFVVHIEPTNRCNFKCAFCVNSSDELMQKYGIERQTMSLALFKKIIDDLTGFPHKIKSLFFHVGGEPLVHKEIIEMIKYAKSKNVADKLLMFSNGALLNNSLCEELGKSGLDLLQISVEGIGGDKYKEITGVKIDYEKFVNQIAYLYQVKGKMIVHAKILDCGMTEEDKAKFYQDFQNISDECYIEHLMDLLPPEDGDTTLGSGKALTQEGKICTEKEVCSNPFYTMSIYCNGIVAPCSCDYRRNLNMGDANEENMVDIWNGVKFHNLRIVQAKHKRRDIEACNVCKFCFNQIDNLDDYSELILGNLQSEKSIESI